MVSLVGCHCYCLFGKAESFAESLEVAAAVLDFGVALEAAVEPPPVPLRVDDGAPALVEVPVLGPNVARELARPELAAVARNVGRRLAEVEAVVVGGERL